MAQSEIGALRVRLAMDAGEFHKGSRRASRDAKKMARDIGKAMAGIAASTAAAAGSMARAAGNVAAEFDQLAKMARTRGVNTDFFQALQLAAEEAGVEQQKLNSALTAFAKRVGEARIGAGPLASKLQEMNAELFEAVKNSESQEEALRLLADAMRQTDNAADKAALAAAAFSRQGVDLVRILNQGSEGFDRTARKAERLGLVMDKAILDRMEGLNNEIGVAERRISTNLSAALASMADQTRDATKFVAGLAEQFRILVDSFAPLEQRQRFTLRHQLAETEQQIAAVIEQLDKARRARASVDGSFGRAGTLLDKRINSLREELRVLQEQELAIAGRLEKIRQMNEIQPPEPETPDGRDPSLPDVPSPRGPSPEEIEAQQRWNFLVQQGISLTQGLATPLDIYREKLEALKAAQSDGAISAQQFARAQQQAAAMTANAYGALAANVARSLEGVFGESKAVAIAQAIINTYQAFTAALANPPGPPFSYAQAAAALASGFAQVQKIRSTTKNSTGGSAGGGQTQAASGGAQGGTGGQAGTRQAVNISLQGETFGREQVRALIEQINEETADGARLVLT